MSPFLKKIRSMIYSFLFLYIGVMLFAYFFSDAMIFHPPSSSYSDDDRAIRDYLVKMTTEDGVIISAFYLRSPEARYTILYSHGNAEDIGHLLPFLEKLRQIGFSVFAYDYHGYGTSKGSPSEQHCYHDIDAAYEYLIKEAGIPSENILALGRSLGGAMAVHLASQQTLGGLILESSFTTAFRTMTHIPLFPVDKFRNISKLDKVKCPVLVIHGTNDEVIGFSHGEKLYKEANNPKMFYRVEEAGHNNLQMVAGKEYERMLLRFGEVVDSLSDKNVR